MKVIGIFNVFFCHALELHPVKRTITQKALAVLFLKENSLHYMISFFPFVFAKVPLYVNLLAVPLVEILKHSALVVENTNLFSRKMFSGAMLQQ